mgnify:CR=1 FL=1
MQLLPKKKRRKILRLFFCVDYKSLYLITSEKFLYHFHIFFVELLFVYFDLYKFAVVSVDTQGGVHTYQWIEYCHAED